MTANQNRWLWIGGLAAGAAVLLYAGVKMEQNAGATTGSAGGLAPNAAAIGVTVTPGAMSVQAAIGQEVDFYLPTGASWTDNSGNVAPGQQAGLANMKLQNSGNAMASVAFSGVLNSSALTLNWTDASGQAQTTTVTIAQA